MAQGARQGHQALGDLHRANHKQPQRRVVGGHKAGALDRRFVRGEHFVDRRVAAFGDQLAGKAGKIGHQRHRP